jgi:heterodisulfide reductase subunit B2
MSAPTPLTVSYYPGCSLESTASEYNASIRAVASMLQIELAEMEDWSCCGSTSAHSLNHDLSVALSARNVVQAESKGRDLVIPCALCFNRLKTAEKALKQGPVDDFTFSGSIRVRDLLDFLSSPEVLSRLAGVIKKPLKNLKAVCYYGCQAFRPPEITDRPDWENPTDMDRVVQACGATALDWPFKTDCCGASHAVARQDLVFELVGRIYDRALAQGAQCFVVSCQMCQANLDMYQDKIGQARGKNYNLPVLYFTELMGLAAGHPDAPKWLSRHFVDPLPLLRQLELL